MYCLYHVKSFSKWRHCNNIVLALRSVASLWYPSACQRSTGQAYILSSRASEWMVGTTGTSCWCKNFYQIFASCQTFTCFNRIVLRVKQLTCLKWDSGLYPSNALATKQPWPKSGGLQDMVGKINGSKTSTNYVRILTAWDELDQRVIDTAVRQWRTRLRAWVKTKGGHFEQNLASSFRPLLVGHSYLF